MHVLFAETSPENNSKRKEGGTMDINISNRDVFTALKGNI